MNRDRLVLNSVLDGVPFTALAKELNVSTAMIREIFFRQVKRVVPDLFDNASPSTNSLKLIKEEIKEKVIQRIVGMSIRTPDVQEQIDYSIRMLVDLGYNVKKLDKIDLRSKHDEDN